MFSSFFEIATLHLYIDNVLIVLSSDKTRKESWNIYKLFSQLWNEINV